MTGLRSKFYFKWTTTQTKVVSHRRRKRFSSSDGFLFRSELRDRRHNTGFWRKEHRVSFPTKIFRAGRLGLLSINFNFRNVIFQPMVFPFVWAKYKWKFERDGCKLSFRRPLAASHTQLNQMQYFPCMPFLLLLEYQDFLMSFTGTTRCTLLSTHWEGLYLSFSYGISWCLSESLHQGPCNLCSFNYTWQFHNISLCWVNGEEKAM